MKALINEIMIVSDSEMFGLLRLLPSRRNFLVEPSGVASVATLLNSHIDVPKGAKTVAVLSGGIIDVPQLKRSL